MSSQAASEKDIKRAQNIALKASLDVERKVTRHNRTADNFGCPTLEALRWAIECGELGEAAVAEALADPSNAVWSWQSEAGGLVAVKAPLLWDAIKNPATPRDSLKWAARLALRSNRFDPWKPAGPLSEDGLRGGPPAVALSNFSEHPAQCEQAQPVSLLEELIRVGCLDLAVEWASQTHEGKTEAAWVDALVVSISGDTASFRDASRPHWGALLHLAQAIKTRVELSEIVSPAKDQQAGAEGQQSSLFKEPRASHGSGERENLPGGATARGDSEGRLFMAPFSNAPEDAPHAAASPTSRGADSPASPADAKGAPPRAKAPWESEAAGWAAQGAMEGIGGAIVDKWWVDAEGYEGGLGGLEERLAVFCDFAMHHAMQLKSHGNASADEVFSWIMSAASGSEPGGSRQNRRPLALWLLHGVQERSEELAKQFWEWMQTAKSFDPRAVPAGEEESLMNLALVCAVPGMALEWAKNADPKTLPASWASLAVLSWHGESVRQDLLRAFLAACERAQLAQAAAGAQSSAAKRASEESDASGAASESGDGKQKSRGRGQGKSRRL